MPNLVTSLRHYLTRYDIKEQIGSGGMATVFRGIDTNLKRDVAIKVLHEHLVHENTFRERFEQEARFIASLNHPNIVQIYDFDVITTDDSSLYYMVMQLVDGQSLDDLMRKKVEHAETLPHERIVQIVQDIADALDYAHDQQAVHRDVKPANILIDNDGHAFLADFGIARLAQNAGITAEGTLIGTPDYMSPEQATGTAIDSRSDIYSLGIIVYELLTGRTPFEGDSAVAILLQHAESPPPPPSRFVPELSEQFDAILLKVLAKNPDDRYKDASAFANTLKTAIDEEDTEQRVLPPTIPRRPELTQKLDTVSTGSSDTAAPQSTRVLETLNTIIMEPARQNPLALVALVVAIAALVIVARVAQPNTPVEPIGSSTLESSTVDNNVPSMTEENFYFTTDFASTDATNQYWQQSSVGNVIRRLDDSIYTIAVESANTATTALFDPVYTYRNVQIIMNGTITEDSASANSALGIVFRYQDQDNYNVFAVDGEGQYSIWRRENGEWDELRNADDTWSPDDAINPIGESNQLSLTIIGDRLTGTINQNIVVALDDDTFDQGGIGIYIASTRAGRAGAIVDSFSVVETGTPGMTDG